MQTRQPFRAGSFYEADPDACRRHAQQLLDAAEPPDDLPQPVFGGLVPHAGWVFSGPLAARTIRALLTPPQPETLVLFGADHWGTAGRGEVYARGAWATPLGEVGIDENLADQIVRAGGILQANPDAHAREHSLEVQVPLLQVAAPGVQIVPIVVPPSQEALEVGRAVGRTIMGTDRTVKVLGSTDLTHHGGHFGSPGGRGEAGEKWTRRNDRRLLDLVERMDASAIPAEVQARGNACGAGAVAATIVACRELGASRGTVLEYTNSYRVAHARYPNDPDDTTVGYASVIFA